MQFNSQYLHTQNKKTLFKNKAWCNSYFKIKQLIKILITTNENFSFLD